MWVRKSDREIEKQNRRLWLSFRGPAIWCLLVFAAAIATILSPRNAEGRWPCDWATFLCRASVVGAIAGVAVYALQIAFQRRIGLFGVSRDVVMCDICHRVKRRDSETECECGGKFGEFDDWKWIDEPTRVSDDE